MNFKKLALATAVASVPVSGMAMEPMADEALSGVTGQDGITISLASDVTAAMKIHDTDGHATTPNSGAMVLSGFSVTRAATTDQISIAIDADGGPAATPAPYLNINVSLPANLTVNLGQLGVADSGRTATGGTWSTSNTVASVVNLGSMTLGATTLNIQLGNEPQGNMVSLNTTITGGISITGFSVSDATSNGSFSTDLTVVDNGGANLTLNTGIDISDGTGDITGSTGIVIGLAGIGGATGVDVRMANVNVGGAGDIGDIEIIGLDLTGNLVISGH